jgi:hypothetical protein
MSVFPAVGKVDLGYRIDMVLEYPVTMKMRASKISIPLVAPRARVFCSLDFVLFSNMHISLCVFALFALWKKLPIH